MIYSCTMFFNELHLLDLRLTEEVPVVDRLIVVESDRTFSGLPKRMLLRSLAGMFPENVELLEVGFAATNAWENEAAQRDAPMREFANDDVILVSDIDEVHRRQDILGIIDAARAHGAVRVVQQNHYYRVNFVTDGQEQWIATALAVTGRYLRETGNRPADCVERWHCRA